MTALYRPFFKQYLYLSGRLNEAKGITPNFITDSEDRIIVLTGVGGRSGFSCLMTNQIPCLDLIEKGQCFPLAAYDGDQGSLDLLSTAGVATGNKSTGLSRSGLDYFRSAYPNKTVTDADIFFYVYGILHSQKYRQLFEHNLSRNLPRVPAVNSFEHFSAFSQAGRKLGELHVDYELVEPTLVNFKQGDLRLSNITDPQSFYRVQKMKFPNKADKSVVFYNSNITMEGIPLEAYNYVVNGKPALEWVMERQCIKKDKTSGILNDANDYAIETMNNPAYPLELFQRVITVSLETMYIVESLPELEID